MTVKARCRRFALGVAALAACGRTAAARRIDGGAAADRHGRRARFRARRRRATAPANPYADDRTAMGEGRQLFVRFNCSGCHGGRAGGGMGPSLRDVDWIYGNNDAQLFSSIAEGRAHGMPSWQTRLTPDQTWKLVAYIKSLRTRNEPQAPPTRIGHTLMSRMTRHRSRLAPS